MHRLRWATLPLVILLGACSGGSESSDQANSTTLTLPATTTAPTSEPTTVAPETTQAPTTSSGTESTPSTVAPGVSPGAAGIGDSLYPQMGNGGYDVLSYLLDLTVDVADNLVAGETTIVATATQDLTAFNVDMSGLIVESVVVNGVDSDYSRIDDELTIAPNPPVLAGDTFETVVAYGGTPEPVDDPSDSVFGSGWHNENGYVYTASEPAGSTSFFPSNNHPSDKATFRFEITAASNLTSAATGVLVDTIENGKTTTTVWEMTDPMATYAAAIYVGDFERRASVGPAGLTIRNYVPPGSAANLTSALSPTADIISFYADLLAPFPFDAYGSVVLPFDLGFAMENQTLSLHGTDTVDTYTLTHEIVHQWFGNSISVADWQDIWLSEGFATYLPLLYLEARGIKSPLDPDGLYFLLDGKAYDGPAEVDVRDLFGESVYFRGALSLHALRVEVGDVVFREILRTYYDRFKGRLVTTEDFEQVVGEIGGPEAEIVLDTWLFGGDLPANPGPVTK